MSRTTKVATTAGAVVAAGVVATLLNGRQRHQRRLRRGEDVEFGSVHSDPITLTATDGVKLNVEVDEADRQTPTVVFVHGWLESIDLWHYQRLALRGSVRMIFVDLRSHGRSGRSNGGSSSIRQLAYDLHTVLSELAPNGPLILVGHSMGGMAIMELASLEPSVFEKRVKGVVLIATSSGKLMRGSPALKRIAPVLRAVGPVLDRSRVFNPPLGILASGAPTYPVVRRWAVGPEAQERHVDMTNEMILKAPAHVLLDFYPNFLTLDLTPGLTALGTATTVVVGGTKDLITPVKHSRALADLIPGARLVVVEGAGHLVVFEEHEQITTIVKDLVEEIR